MRTEKYCIHDVKDVAQQAYVKERYLYNLYRQKRLQIIYYYNYVMKDLKIPSGSRKFLGISKFLKYRGMVLVTF